MGREGEDALVTLCPLYAVKTTYTMLPESAGKTLTQLKLRCHIVKQVAIRLLFHFIFKT